MLLSVAIGYIGYMSTKGDERKVVMELIHISKRVFEAPKFFYYALADALFAIFARAKPGFSHLLQKMPKDMQLSLWPAPRLCALQL
jgi:hypothetical protein